MKPRIFERMVTDVIDLTYKLSVYTETSGTSTPEVIFYNGYSFNSITDTVSDDDVGYKHSFVFSGDTINLTFVLNHTSISTAKTKFNDAMQLMYNTVGDEKLSAQGTYNSNTITYVQTEDTSTLQPKPSIDGHLPMYSGTSGIKIEDANIDASAVRTLAGSSSNIISHLSDTIKHVTADDKTQIANDHTALNNHIGTVGVSLHVSTTDRANWDAKETPTDAQAKADAVQANLDTHINDYDLHLTTDEKTLLSTGIYSKTEIDNKLAQLTNGLDWKEAVQKYSDLPIVYPDAKDGWTANVIEDGVTYRYTMPKNILDLEASGYSEQYLLDHKEEFAESYTVVWIESMGYYRKWNGTNWVVTADVGSWIAISANAIPKATEEKDGLMSKEDYYKLLHIEDELPRASTTNDGFMTSDDFKHLSEVYASQEAYLELYDCVQQGDPKITIDAEGISTYKYKGIFTPAERTKLAAIEDDANYYVHPTTHSADIIEETTTRHFITAAQLASLDNMATKALATLETDGLMSKEMFAKLSDIDYRANNYIHPDTHEATMIETDENHRFVSDANKVDIAKISTLEQRLNNIKAGTGIFTSTGTSIVHNCGSLDYSLTVTPFSTTDDNPNDNVTNVWVKYEANVARVYCNLIDPSKETKFAYTLIFY